MRIHIDRIGSQRVQLVRVSADLAGGYESIQRPVPPVHLLTPKNRPLCDPSARPITRFPALSWTAIGMHDLWCADCEALRQSA